MRLSEYEGMLLLSDGGLRANPGTIAKTPDEAREAFAKTGETAVLKAMIPVGGRGKAGLVKIVRNADEAATAAHQMLGRIHSGHCVKELILSPAQNVEREFYLSVIYRADLGHPELMFSIAGGVDIEQVAKETPERIRHFDVTNEGELLSSMAEGLLNAGLEFSIAKQTEVYARALAKLAVTNKLTLAEINPLVLTKENELIALDCKIEMDDAAAAQHPKYATALPEEYADLERDVRGLGGTLVGLDGDIGVICNGAGMGMAIVDMLADQGLHAANFLDTGGGPNQEKSHAICSLMFKQKGLRGMIISFWGGFTLLDGTACGIVGALRESGWNKPLVVKMFGINQEEARQILTDAGISVADKMQTEAAVQMLADMLKAAEV